MFRRHSKRSTELRALKSALRTKSGAYAQNDVDNAVIMNAVKDAGYEPTKCE